MSDSTNTTTSDLDMTDIVAKLTASPSRDEASKFLDGFDKKNLERIARHLDVAMKQDKSSLRNSIVEATVGARLRSEAIRGRD